MYFPLIFLEPTGMADLVISSASVTKACPCQKKKKEKKRNNHIKFLGVNLS
jgi:hypothetical protein